MKPSKLLCVLSCLAAACIGSGSSAAAPGGPAPVLFKGLQYSSVGASDLKADKVTGALLVSNIGSSGQDGVSVSCLHTDGMQLALDGSSTAADDGASCTMTYHWSLISRPASSLSTVVRYVVSTNGNHFGVDFSSMSSSPTERVTLSRDGLVVYTAVVPTGTEATVAPDPTGSCPNPTLSCFATRDPTEKLHVEGSLDGGLSFSSVVHVTVAAHDEDCDDVEFTAPIDVADQDCDGVSCDLLVASPAGSSFGTVSCSDGACRLFDEFVEGGGQAQVDVHSGATTGRRQMQVSNIGSSGQDGLKVGLGKPPIETLDIVGADRSRTSGSADFEFSPSSLLFDPATDVGASATITIVGKLFSLTGAPGSAPPPTPASASMKFTLSTRLHLSMEYSPMVAGPESVAVLNHGVEVARYALAQGGVVDLSAPPGQPAAFMIASMGKTHTKTGHVTLMKAPMLSLRGAGGAVPASSNPYFKDNDLSGEMQASFRSVRVVTCGSNPPVAGDQVVCWGDGSCSSGTCYDTFVAGNTELHVASTPTSYQLGSLAVEDLTSSIGDVIFADVPGSTVLSNAHTCVTVPFRFARVDQTPVRAYSVQFHLSPELARCGASVVEGDYLSRFAGTQMFVTDNGGGSYTVDCGILGPVCGPTDSGTLFSVDLSAVQPVSSDEGFISVDAVRVRDCNNAPVPGDPGSSAGLAIQTGALPTPAVTATTQKSGNLVVTGTPGGAVAAIVVTFQTNPVLGSTGVVDLYRAPFGNYPLYDKGSAPGHAPSPPATESAASSSGWTPVTCSSGACDGSSLVDVPPGRDFYYYVAFARDAFGNVSPPSSMTTGTLDYHLGDVSDGLAVCSGDNLVDITDISALGAHYGSRVSPNDSWTCLDVGPTTDFSVDTRPTVDGMVEFEDLMMYAMNFSVVSAPSSARRPVAAATNATQLVVPALPAPGQTFDAGVVVDGAGDLQGVSVRLGYDPNVLEQVGVTAGSLLGEQDRASAVLSSGPGDVDVALLGGGSGIAGHGELARVTFRVKGAGDPLLAIASLNGRGSDNRPVTIAGAVGGTGVPAHSALGFAYPNPFRQSLAFQLSLHSAGPAAIGVFDVAGRRVRTLVAGTQPAGSRIVTWDGRDDSGVQLAPGAYIVRLEASGMRESRTVRLVR